MAIAWTRQRSWHISILVTTCWVVGINLNLNPSRFFAVVYASCVLLRPEFYKPQTTYPWLLGDLSSLPSVSELFAGLFGMVGRCSSLNTATSLMEDPLEESCLAMPRCLVLFFCFFWVVQVVHSKNSSGEGVFFGKELLSECPRLVCVECVR